MYKNKNPIETIEDFTKLVREIEIVKNYINIKNLYSINIFKKKVIKRRFAVCLIL